MWTSFGLPRFTRHLHQGLRFAPTKGKPPRDDMGIVPYATINYKSAQIVLTITKPSHFICIIDSKEICTVKYNQIYK